MRRKTFDATPDDDDSQPVMVPRNLKALVPVSHERVRRLREHLVRTLRAMRTQRQPFVSSPRPEPEGFAGRVARAACTLCAGFCCRNGADDGFLDDPALARLRHVRPALDARAVVRLYLERVPANGYEGSCIFHGEQGCTLDRSMRSDVCNAWFCEGLYSYIAGVDPPEPTMVIAGEGNNMRRSRVLIP
jgi:hypothetical protein